MSNRVECRVKARVDDDGMFVTEWQQNGRVIGGGPSFGVGLVEPLRSLVNASAAEDSDPRLGGAERVAMGCLLYRLLVPNHAIDTRLGTLLGECREGERRLRLVLELQSPELEALPWELLMGPDHHYLALTQSVSIVRSGDPKGELAPVHVDGPIRIRYIDAGAVGTEESWLQKETWAVDETLADAVDRSGAADRRCVVWEDVEGQLRFRPGGPNVFHFTGHGRRDEDGRVELCFSDVKGGQRAEDGTEGIKLSLLGGALEKARIQLAVLGACEAGTGANWRGLGAALLNSVPCVVSMQTEIVDGAASEFSKELYISLGCGQDLEDAVARGRQRLAAGAGTTSWWIPMLHSAQHDALKFPADPLISARVGTSAEWIEPTLDEAELRRRSDAARYWLNGREAQTEVIVSPDGRYAAEYRQGDVAMGPLTGTRLDVLHSTSLPAGATVRALFGSPSLRALLITRSQITQELRFGRSRSEYWVAAEWDRPAESAAWAGDGFLWLPPEQQHDGPANEWNIHPGPGARQLDLAVGGSHRLAAWTEGLDLVVSFSPMDNLINGEQRRRVRLHRAPRAVIVPRTTEANIPTEVYVDDEGKLIGWDWDDLERP